MEIHGAANFQNKHTHDQIWHKSIEDLLEKKMPDTTFDFNFLAAMMDKPNLVRSFDAS